MHLYPARGFTPSTRGGRTLEKAFRLTMNRIEKRLEELARDEVEEITASLPAPLAGPARKVPVIYQARPDPDDGQEEDLLGLFPPLRESGLVSISFGIESGNQRILDSMRKGTKVDIVQKVLSESRQAGIKNIVFIMFGFPGEDEASFIDTMDFLRSNCKNVDIVSASVFGLQKGSYVYAHPEEFGVFGIREHATPLGESISYKVMEGLSEKQTKVMKEDFAKELRELNQLPKIFCLLKEQSLFF